MALYVTPKYDTFVPMLEFLLPLNGQTTAAAAAAKRGFDPIKNSGLTNGHGEQSYGSVSNNMC